MRFLLPAHSSSTSVGDRGSQNQLIVLQCTFHMRVKDSRALSGRCGQLPRLRAAAVVETPDRSESTARSIGGMGLSTRARQSGDEECPHRKKKVDWRRSEITGRRR